MINKSFKSGSAHPPLSGKSLTGSGFWALERSIFGGKKGRHDTTANVIASDTTGGARQSRSDFCGLLRRSFITPRNDSRVFAFTLAEVLITLVIIGVVAALTIPNLMQKYTEQNTVKKVQKFYSNLSNAYSLAMKDNGPASEWGLTGMDNYSTEKIYELLFKPYFKIGKDCGTSNTGKCAPTAAYKQLNGLVSNGITGNNYHKIVLDDGSLVWWRGPMTSETPGTMAFALGYDVNGNKGPNQYGIDAFDFVAIGNQIIPIGLQTGPFAWRQFNSNCRNRASSGYGCAAWLVYKGNMDYLHCDLTWDKHSCKD